MSGTTSFNDENHLIHLNTIFIINTMFVLTYWPTCKRREYVKIKENNWKQGEKKKKKHNKETVKNKQTKKPKKAELEQRESDSLDI